MKRSLIALYGKESLFIPNVSKFNDKLEQLRKVGTTNIDIIADFDFTLSSIVLI